MSKLEPSKRVNKINEILGLFSDNTKDKKDPYKKSAKEKCEYYGIEIKPEKNLFTAYYMNQIKLIDGDNKEINSNDRTFNIYKKKNLTNWVCFYEKNNYNDADNLYKTLSKESKAFGLKVTEPEWVEIKNNSTAKDWTDIAENYFGKGKNDYDFALFLLGKNDKIYPELKKHSLCKNGYVSQVVKARSFQKIKAMSVCSKILLQINAKLGGISYKILQDKTISDRNLMIIGIDFSHIKGKRTGVAMVATINSLFFIFY